jgi:Protein of unknown function (DUF5818)
MTKKLVLLFALVLFAGFAWCAPESWTGTVSDNQCAATKHGKACIEKCVAAGAKYVLVSKGKAYTLDAQDKFKGLGGERVKVTGTLSGDNAITVQSVSAK